MDDNQKPPRSGLTRPSTFSLILDFTGEAELQDSPAPVNLSLPALVSHLNTESAAVGTAIAEEIKTHFKPQLPAADVSVTIDFSLGSIRWSGVVLIADVFAGIHDNPGFAGYVRKATQSIVNKTIRRRIEEEAAQQGASVKSVETHVAAARKQIHGHGRRNFLWWCAGAVPETLRDYPTERAKYEGIGGAVLTTGVLAFLSGFYAIYTTLATGPYGTLISIGFGLLWAAAIFNLDRYIVSSLHKPTNPDLRWPQRLARTWLPALPRLGLAILIGITLSKPLELRLFQNAISAQAELNRDQAVTAKRAALTESSRLGEVSSELTGLDEQIGEKENRARLLDDDFRKEADGTGGSLRYGYSAVARVKEAAALQARQEADSLRNSLQGRVQQLQAEKDRITTEIDRGVDVFRQSLTGDFLTRMKALADLSANSVAVWWISTFVVLLLIAIEITPVLVKVLSPVGPYDVKVDALNSVGTNEALLKKDTAMRIAAHHYAQTEKAELQADDTLLDIRTGLAARELQHKADEWTTAKASGASVTIDQFINEVRTEVLTGRSLG